MSSVGSRIKNRRLEMDMTADRLAEKVGVARATMFRYESGELSAISCDTLVKIAAALNTTVSYLVGEDYSYEKLSPRIREVISIVSRLSDEDCDILVPVLDVLLQKQYRAESLLSERESSK